jgi:hypothetical protein
LDLVDAALLRDILERQRDESTCTHERDTVMSGPVPPKILPANALQGKTAVVVTAERLSNADQLQDGD